MYCFRLLRASCTWLVGAGDPHVILAQETTADWGVLAAVDDGYDPESDPDFIDSINEVHSSSLALASSTLGIQSTAGSCLIASLTASSQACNEHHVHFNCCCKHLTLQGRHECMFPGLQQGG